MFTLVQRIREELPRFSIVESGDSDAPDTDATQLLFPVSGERRGDIVIDEDFIQGNQNRRLIASAKFPLKPHILESGQENIKKNFFPIAEWDGKRLRISIPKEKISRQIEAAIYTPLKILITGNLRYQQAETDFSNILNLGLTKERTSLLHTANNYDRRVEALLDEAKELTEKANRKRKVAEVLETTDITEAQNFARAQWHDMCQMIPTVLQDLWIEGTTIVALTQQVYLEGILLGPYNIKIPVTTPDQLRIYVDLHAPQHPSGYHHPHVNDQGTPCWGNLTGYVTKMAGQKNYYGLIAVALKLLHHHNPDDHYAPLAEWTGEPRLVRPDEEESSYCSNNEASQLGTVVQVQECIKCLETSDTSCPFGYQLGNLYSSCHAMTQPRDCVACSSLDCPHKSSAFDVCAMRMANQGTAYCLLRCPYYKECKKSQNTHDLQALCKDTNLSEEGTCPAVEMCADPCERSC